MAPEENPGYPEQPGEAPSEEQAAAAKDEGIKLEEIQNPDAGLSANHDDRSVNPDGPPATTVDDDEKSEGDEDKIDEGEGEKVEDDPEHPDADGEVHDGQADVNTQTGVGVEGDPATQTGDPAVPDGQAPESQPQP